MTINAQFDTRVNATTVERQVALDRREQSEARRAASGVRRGLQRHASVTAAGLYPFLDGYGIYAGQCTTNAPGTLPNTAPAPGSPPVQPRNPKIRVPSINVRVVNSTSTTAGTRRPGRLHHGRQDRRRGVPTPSRTRPAPRSPRRHDLRRQRSPSPAARTASYRVCAQRTVSGVTRRGFADVYPYATGAAVNTVNEVVNNTNANRQRRDVERVRRDHPRSTIPTSGSAAGRHRARDACVRAPPTSAASRSSRCSSPCRSAS